MDHDQIQELLEAHALGALDADDQAMVEQHLSKCDGDCPRLAKEYADLVHTFPQALSAASTMRVPASMKNRLLLSLNNPLTVKGQGTTRSPSRDGKSNRARRPFLDWQWSNRLRPRVVAFIAALVLLVLALAWGLDQSVALARERALRAEYANLVGQQELVLEVVDSNKTVKALLRPMTSASPAYGKLYTRPDMSYVVAMAARLPPPSAGQAYHLWLTSQGKTQLAGVMAVNSQGFGLVIFQANLNGPVYKSAQLTLQPEGGTAPSGGPVLTWEASR